MTYRHFKHEGWLYALAFLLALGLRLAELGAVPLTDAEALPALQALHIAQGLKPALSPHPFYILSTSIFFFLYGGGTDFLARIAPALAGSLLVFAPLFLQRIKPRPSLILAFFTAIDPGLVALSRQAASPIFAITFLLLAWGFYSQNKPRLTGFFAALALLGGPSVWAGLLGLGISWALYQAFDLRRKSRNQPVDESAETELQPHTASFRVAKRPSAIWSFAITLLTAGTLFFIAPNGLSAALASIPAYIISWQTPSDVPASRLFLSLLVYQPLTLLLAIFAIIRGWRKLSGRIIPISIWLLVSLLLAVFIPSRQVSDLAWTLIPLSALAALELVRSIDMFPEERIEVAGVVLLTAFIWAFSWLDFSKINWIQANSQEYFMRLWLLFGALLLLVFSILLVASGWSIRTARIGGAWGLAFVLGAFGLGGALGSAGLRGLSFPELWWQPNIPAQADLLRSTVNNLSEWEMGDDNSAPVLIAGVNSPALEWALREHQVTAVESLDISSSPYFVITPLQDNPALASSYRGQDFTWRQTPLWNDTLSTQSWVRWVTLRQMPQSGEIIILWARDDLFLGSSPNTNP
ncbi:MAG: hypothetical protein HY864_10975 [Chloroflexi bacterium]|nr:hypothetical protein [Chloroflexota bacterium]